MNEFCQPEQPSEPATPAEEPAGVPAFSFLPGQLQWFRSNTLNSQEHLGSSPTRYQHVSAKKNQNKTHQVTCKNDANGNIQKDRQVKSY